MSVSSPLDQAGPSGVPGRPAARDGAGGRIPATSARYQAHHPIIRLLHRRGGANPSTEPDGGGVSPTLNAAAGRASARLYQEVAHV